MRTNYVDSYGLLHNIVDVQGSEWERMTRLKCDDAQLRSLSLPQIVRLSGAYIWLDCIEKMKSLDSERDEKRDTVNMLNEQQSPTEIPPLRVLFKTIADGLSPEELKTIKNLLIDSILLRKDEKKYEDALSLFIYLETNGSIDAGNLGLLEVLLTNIKRPLLIDEINKFKNDYETNVIYDFFFETTSSIALILGM
ncbi:uncharacterized protein LOC144359242 [Saccoglossus kowalevskii]